MNDVTSLLHHLYRGGMYGYYWLKQPDAPGQKPRKKTIWFSASQVPPVPRDKAHIYWGVHPTNIIPQREKEGRILPSWAVRAENEEIAAVNCLFADIDAKDFNHDKAAALEHINHLPWPASVLVDSGGGYQVYWLLKDTFVIDSPDAMEYIRGIQAGWGAFVLSDPKARDIARVLRVPGTYNYKAEYGQPRPVQMMHCYLDELYELNDFERYITAAPKIIPVAAAQPAAHSNGNGHHPQQPAAQPGQKYNNTPEDWGQYFLSQAVGRAAAGNRNHTGFWLARQLQSTGMDRTTAERFMLAYASQVPQPPGQQYTPDEAITSLDSAYKKAPLPAPKRNGSSPAAQQQPAAPAATTSSSDAGQQQPCPQQPAGVKESDLIPGTWLPLEVIKKGYDDRELGDVSIMASLFDGKLCYDHTESAWHLWQGHHWCPDNTGVTTWAVAQGVAPQYLHMAADVLTVGDNKTSQAFIERARALQTKNRISNIIALAKDHETFRLSGQEWDKDPMILACSNGVINLGTGEFRPGLPSDYVRSPSPVEWKGINEPCPVFEKFISDIFDGDSQMVDFLGRLLGYGITGLTTEHVLPVFWGEGRNGKTTLLEILGSVLGPELATSSQADALMDLQKIGGGPQPFIYGLRGKRFVWASESNEGRRINAGLVKQLTGGDRISVRTLHSKPIEFKPTHMLILITNHKPHISADDQAIWERVLLVPFTLKFVDNPQPGTNERLKDKNLPAKLTREMPGILAWLVRGCLAWQQHGLQPPALVQAATQEYKDEEDTTGLFLRECTNQQPGNESRAGELYKAYQTWCNESGLNAMSLTAFGKAMKKRFKHKESHGIVYLGVGLLMKPPC